jgi:DNA-directed RNA polymerase subunit beta'
MFDDDADLADIVLDDRTARNYNVVETLEERPSFSFESFGSGDGADYGAAYKSPILDDDELIDDTIGGAIAQPAAVAKADDDDDLEDDLEEDDIEDDDL